MSLFLEGLSSMNAFKLAMAIVYASVLVVLAVAVDRVGAAEIVVFQDNFEGRTAGDPLSVALPQVGAAYTSGYARDVTTNPPGGVAPGGGGIFAESNVADQWLGMTNASATVGKVSQFDLDLFVVSGAGGGASGVDLMTFTDTSYSNRGIDIFFQGDGTITYYDGASHAVPGTFTTNVWNHVTVNADYSLHTFTASIGSLAFSGALTGSTTGYGYVNVYGSDRFYDNVLVRVDPNPVPEPSTMVLLVTGLVGLLAYAWRKRK
jgi:hypothetical protein